MVSNGFGFHGFVAIIIALLVTWTPSCWAGADDAPDLQHDGNSVDADNVIESFRIDGGGGLLIIPVKIAGIEYPFAIDTGLTTAVFDSPLKGSLEPIGETARVNGGDRVELYNCPSATVGRSKFGIGSRAFCVDLADSCRETGYTISGFLGMGFLKGKVIQIDSDAGRVSILKDGALVVGQRIPMTFDSVKRPCIDVDLPTVGKTPFLIDTGCCGFRSGFLSKATFGALRRANDLQILGELKNDVSGLDGPADTEVGLLAWQEVSGLRHRALVYSLDNSTKSEDGLGLGFLCRFKLTLDFPTGELILEKGKWFGRNCPANQAGIDMECIQGIPTVIWVDPDGPAWKAGIRPADRIVQVDGRMVEGLRMDEIGGEFYWARRGVKLKVIHAMETASHDIRLMHERSRRRDSRQRPVKSP